MLRKLRHLFQSPFPFYLNTDRDNAVVVLAIALFTLLFLLIFRPFGLADEIREPSAPFVFAGITLAVLALHVLALPRLFPRFYDEADWTLGSFALYNLWIMAIVALLATVYSHYWLENPRQDTFGQHLLGEQVRVLLIGVFPVSAMFFVIWNRMLLRSLRDVRSANRNLLLQRIDPGVLSDLVARQDKSGAASPAPDWVVHAETQETVELPDGSLLFAEAEDNYSRLFWVEDGEVQRRLLRLTLKNLEGQLPSERVARVHRSYLVNLERIDALRGNASGYRLYFAGPGVEVPVARTRSREILDRIEELGNLNLQD
jgi:hypothetical protein